MWIANLDKTESLDLLARTGFGRLGCAFGLQPYVVPFTFACRNAELYSSSMVGMKIDWMRKNPLVSVESDEIVNPREWKSVVVLGTFHELSDAHSKPAYELLQQHPNWWEPAFVATTLHSGERPVAPIYFRISIREISGRQAIDSTLPGTAGNRAI